MKLEDFDDDMTPVDEPVVKDEIDGGRNRNSVRAEVDSLNSSLIQLYKLNIEARDMAREDARADRAAFREEAKSDRLAIKGTLDTLLRRMFIRDAVLFAIAIAAFAVTALNWNRVDVLEQRVTAVERAP